jgi:hypothetical protein
MVMNIRPFLNAGFPVPIPGSVRITEVAYWFVIRAFGDTVKIWPVFICHKADIEVESKHSLLEAICIMLVGHGFSYLPEFVFHKKYVIIPLDNPVAGLPKRRLLRKLVPKIRLNGVISVAGFKLLDHTNLVNMFDLVYEITRAVCRPLRIPFKVATFYHDKFVTDGYSLLVRPLEKR